MGHTASARGFVAAGAGTSGPMHTEDTGDSAATITPYEDGPLLVRGDFSLVTPDGERIDARRGTVALCRCGKSALKPFCDGTHKVVNFRAGTGREA
ncbi:CDGSH iron-sulfur domain-containing protein [Micromonospora sp. NPDC049274]|uniref:CDGSH iron-sulfur domain-containing protein n=1 Tax=Micromonospora sp. NPDC049274 TaxID=3154829 RepID=UPI0034440B72